MVMPVDVPHFILLLCVMPDYFSNQLNVEIYLFLEIEVSKRPEDSVYKIFQDPTARHAIICLRSFESLYLARSSKKPKPIPKLKVDVCSCFKHRSSFKINYCFSL